MVDAYEAQQDFAKAEELLINLWSRLTEGKCNFVLALLFFGYGNADNESVNSLREVPDTGIAG